MRLRRRLTASEPSPKTTDFPRFILLALPLVQPTAPLCSRSGRSAELTSKPTGPIAPLVSQDGLPLTARELHCGSPSTSVRRFDFKYRI
jgi:hypothetical protein